MSTQRLPWPGVCSHVQGGTWTSFIYPSMLRACSAPLHIYPLVMCWGSSCRERSCVWRSFLFVERHLSTLSRLCTFTLALSLTTDAAVKLTCRFCVTSAWRFFHWESKMQPLSNVVNSSFYTSLWKATRVSREKKNWMQMLRFLKGVWFYLNLLWDVSEVSATDRLTSPPGVDAVLHFIFLTLKNRVRQQWLLWTIVSMLWDFFMLKQRNIWG